MPRWLPALFLALALLPGPARAAETTPARFYMGANGTLPAWLVAGPFGAPHPELEPGKGLGSPPTETPGRWQYFNAGPHPAIGFGGLRKPGPRTFLYLDTTIHAANKQAGELIFRAFGPLRVWFNNKDVQDTELVVNQGQRLYILSLDVDLEPGLHRLRIRMDCSKSLPVMACALQERNKEEPFPKPLTSNLLELSLSEVSLRKAASRKPELKVKTSPRFVDGKEAITLEATIKADGCLATGDTITVSCGLGEALHPLPQSIQTREANNYNLRTSIPVPPNPTWRHQEATVSITGKGFGTCSDSSPVFHEARLLADTETLRRYRSSPAFAESHRSVQALIRLSLEQIDKLTSNRQRRTLFYGEHFERALSRSLRAMAAPKKDPLTGLRGVQEGAYLSEIDDSVQPYRFYIPGAIDAKKKIPLILLLHGYVPSYNKLSWVSINPEMAACFDELGAALLLPFGRSCTDFLTIGEEDVLTTVEEICRRYPIDRNRIYLTGYSMGGSGAWTLLSHFPDKWAAGQVWSGRTDYYYWHEERLASAGLDRETLPFYKKLLINTDNPYTLWQTLRDIPILAIHPTDDQLVKQGHSTRIHERLKPPAGQMHLRSENHSLGHWLFTVEMYSPPAYQWMLQHRRKTPTSVRHTCYTPKYGQKDWLRIEALSQWGKEASVNGKIENGNTLILDSLKNVASLTFAPPDPAQEWQIHAGHGYSTTQIAPDRYSIVQKDWAPKGVFKSPALSGPVKEAFNSRFVLVRGTTGTAEQQQRNRDNVDQFEADWQTFAHGTPRIKSDKELKAEDVQTNNLILFGCPESNRYIKRIVGRLPYRFIKGGYAIGAHEAKGQGLGLCAIYPNPENPGRYIVLLDGLYYGKELSFNHKWDLVPDFIVFGEETDTYDSTNTAHLAGFMDQEWQVAERLIFRGHRNGK